MAKKPTPAPAKAGETQESAPAETATADEAPPAPPPEVPTPVVALADPAPTVVVTALQSSFRRIGRQFGREPVAIPAEDLTEAEFAVLQAEPMLVVQVVAAPH